MLVVLQISHIQVLATLVRSSAAGGMSQTHVHDLEAQSLVKIFSSLTAKELTAASLVCKHWQAHAHEEQLWQRLLLEDWVHHQAQDWQGTTCSSSRLAYVAWATEFHKDPCLPYVRDALRAWMPIKAWLRSHFPVVYQSLQPGVTRAEVEAAAQELGQPLPAPLAAIYRVCNGQQLTWDLGLDVQSGRYRGHPEEQAMDQRFRALLQADRAQRAARRSAGGGGADGVATPPPPPPPGSRGSQGDPEEDEEHAVPEPQKSIYHGMFGGYSFYNVLAVTRMLPLQRAIWWTRNLSSVVSRAPPPPPGCLVFSASFQFVKYFSVDLQSGHIKVNTSSPARFLAAVPTELPGTTDATAQPGVLVWLNEYARRLQSGWYQVAPLDLDMPEAKAISLFPRQPPALSVAVTRGVRVTASTIYVPEQSRASRGLFTYSISMSLESEEQQQREIEARALQPLPQGSLGARLSAGGSDSGTRGGLGGRDKVLRECQLMSRHWRILDAQGSVIDEVAGEGVIGKFPLLEAGAEVFSYQSCTQQDAALGYMEGEFRFVEGSLSDASPPEFDVVCPRFTLEVPKFIF